MTQHDPAAPEASDELETAPVAPSYDELEAELDRTRAAYARAMADYQNLQRRSREDRAEQTRLTMKALLLNYLPVLDDLNRALESVTQHAELTDHPWIEGVRIVQRKFVSILESAGVKPIEASVGVTFDPQIHEAVAYGAGPQNTIVAVVQGGYAIDTTVIRPAMVVVGNGESDAGTI